MLSQDTGWHSGAIALANKSSLNLPLTKRGNNKFQVRVYDNSGRQVELENGEIEIAYTLATVNSILASHSIGVEVCENSMSNHSVLDYLVREGDPLPAKGQKRFRATENVKAGSSDAINFKLWEGDQQDNVEDNRFIGCMTIGGNDFDFGVIMTGAEIICDYVVNDSGSIELDISVPSIAESFNNDKNFYSRQEGQLDLDASAGKINYDGKQLLEKVRTLNAALDGDRYTEELQDAGMLASKAMNISQENTDREELQHTVDSIIQAKRQLNRIRRENLEDIRTRELSDMEEVYEQKYKQFANGEEQEQYHRLFATARSRINESGRGFEDIIERIRYLNYDVMAKNDDFIVYDFKRLISSPEEFDDLEAMKQLAQQGIAAINQNDIKTLRQVVGHLWYIRRDDDNDMGENHANIVRG